MENDLRAVGSTKGGFVNHLEKEVRRLITLHAGGGNGWIDGAALVFQSKKATGGANVGARHHPWIHLIVSHMRCFLKTGYWLFSEQLSGMIQ